MDQSITIKIAGKDYPLKASSPEMERLMRLAAEDINRMLAKYDEKFPFRSLEEKLSFVTLNETIGKISAQNKFSSVCDEVGTLNAEIEKYLEGKEGK